MNYTDKEISDYLELAQETGITKAKRELGYPKSWDTARRWAELRGIELPADDVKARAAHMREWYRDEEVITIAQEGMNRVHESLTNESLTADDQAKLSRAFSTYVKDWLTIQGRSNQITESRQGDELDGRIAEMLAVERAKNAVSKTRVKEDSEQVI